MLQPATRGHTTYYLLTNKSKHLNALNLSCCFHQTPPPPPPPPIFSSSVHDFSIFMNLQHPEPLSAQKRLLFSSKAENETNIVFHKSLEAWSSPLLSDIGSRRSSQGPLIKEQVWPSVSLTAERAEQRHTDYTCHGRLTWNAPWMLPADTRGGKKNPPKINPRTFQRSLGSHPLEDIVAKVRDTWK